VTREPEWDAFARSEALAAVHVERSTCRQCGARDSLEVVGEPAQMTWGEHKVEVQQYRCVTCMALDVVRRDFNEALPKDKPKKGHATPGDGMRFVATPVSEPEGGDE
jgi:hypothetical protein